MLLRDVVDKPEVGGRHSCVRRFDGWSRWYLFRCFLLFTVKRSHVRQGSNGGASARYKLYGSKRVRCCVLTSSSGGARWRWTGATFSSRTRTSGSATRSDTWRRSSYNGR